MTTPPNSTASTSQSLINTSFITKDNLPVNSISLEQQQELFTKLGLEFGISPLQMVEAGAFSLAMVVRFALGLSAEGGASIAVIQDSLAGAIAVAGIRHLTNSGAQSAIFIITDKVSSDTVINSSSDKIEENQKALAPLSPLLKQQLAPLIRSGLEVYFLAPTLPPHTLHELLPLAHNVIVGFGGLKAGDVTDTSKMGFIVEALNDAMTPIHCIDYPPGLDPETGKASANTIFASSTLSLGLPLNGLKKAGDYMGRHYLCDISLPPVLLAESAIDLPFIFADQPVKQIFPVNPKENIATNVKPDSESEPTSASERLEGLAAEAQRSLEQNKNKE